MKRSKPVWVIFHRMGVGMRWFYMKSKLHGHVGGLPLCQFEMPRLTVTLPEYIFETKAKAKAAVKKKNAETAVQALVNQLDW